MIAVCGETGSGKSYAAMSIGERCDPNFSVDNVCFSIPEYLDALERSGPGDVLVFDESQAWGARRAMSKKNVAMSDVAAMCRFTLVSTIFTAPALSFIDVNLRRLMHIYAHISPIDRSRCPPWQRTRTFARAYTVSHPQFPGGDQGAGSGLRFAYPRIPVERDGQRRGVVVEAIWLPAPSRELLEQYERRKRETFEARLDEARRTLAPTSPQSARGQAVQTPEAAGDEDDIVRRLLGGVE